MGAENLFDSVNALSNTLEFISADSPEELRLKLREIRLPTRLITIYAVGSKHVAWIQTTAKLKKKKE